MPLLHLCAFVAHWRVNFTFTLEMGITPHGGSVGQPRVGSSPGDFERWLKGALEVGHLSLSLWELCEGNLEGRLPCWGP